MPDQIVLPEGVTTYTLDGERPHTTYKLGDQLLLGAQDCLSRPGLILAAIPGVNDKPYAVVRVTAEQLPNLLAVLADLRRPTVTSAATSEDGDLDQFRGSWVNA